jgi:hypothetical protein
LSRAFEFPGIAGANSDPAAFARKPPRQRESEAARASGHERDITANIPLARFREEGARGKAGSGAAGRDR